MINDNEWHKLKNEGRTNHRDKNKRGAERVMREINYTGKLN